MPPMLNIGANSYENVAQAIGALGQIARQAGERDPYVHRALGEALALAGRAEEAIAAYRNAMASGETAADHVRLAELLMRRQRPQEAWSHLERVTAAIGPDHALSVRLAQTLDELADAFFAASDLTAALKCHDEAWRLAPGHVDSAVGAALKRYQDDVLRRVASELTPAAEGGATYQMTLAVWGEAYARSFLETCLPSLLARGNLPYLAARVRVRLTIFADEAARIALERAEAFETLKAHADPMFVEIPDFLIAQTKNPDLPPSVRYRVTLQLVTAQHQLAMIMAAACGAGLFFLVPDWVLSDDCFKEIHTGVQAGKGLFAAPILLSNKRGVAKALAPLATGEGACAIPAADLARLGVVQLHDSWRQFVPKDDRFEARQFPSWMLWPFGEAGLVFHAFHWSVLCIGAERLSRYGGQRFWTLDHRLIDVLLADDEDWRNVALCTDTDALTVIALEDEGKTYAWANEQSWQWRLQELVGEAMPGTGVLSLSRVSHLLFRESVVFGGDGGGPAKDAALSAARAIVDAVSAQVPDVSIKRV